uniref:Uncharacterized protein n=1 Tax=Leersia perrieri TaxID=77586 RepID=A0A0D9VWH2_9ORYZ
MRCSQPLQATKKKLAVVTAKKRSPAPINKPSSPPLSITRFSIRTTRRRSGQGTVSVGSCFAEGRCWCYGSQWWSSRPPRKATSPSCIMETSL